MVSDGRVDACILARDSRLSVASLREGKYWVPVGRADNVYGDRNLVCSCPPLSDYE